MFVVCLWLVDCVCCLLFVVCRVSVCALFVVCRAFGCCLLVDGLLGVVCSLLVFGVRCVSFVAWLSNV